MEACGPITSRLKPGDRVMAFCPFGGYAEKVVLTGRKDADKVRRFVAEARAGFASIRAGADDHPARRSRC